MSRSVRVAAASGARKVILLKSGSLRLAVPRNAMRILDFAKLLLMYGADLKMKNNAGLTPSEAAMGLKPFPGRISRKTNKKAVIDLLHSAGKRIEWN